MCLNKYILKSLFGLIEAHQDKNAKQLAREANKCRQIPQKKGVCTF